ncbi:MULTISPECIES: ATP-binding protein [Acinetobacter]|uniref:ATP-binding protein n=1 Tax=Acinetobacter ursingii TaxID=108980 RepID=A0AA46S5R9_9GAMM|nr:MULTISPECIES: ATP-binding protein [Acinetobacter]MCU4521975.1 ATP-binding protein [Acinetobacter ursingii]MPW44839.1 ATP-binding protein [Acinetobacter guerrae]UYF72990.1 ATP-binding protein [Acinetobacter ursingii]
MSIATLILGQSGTGKSASLRNLNPQHVLLIQVIKKPLPFRSPNWTYITPDNKQGSILVSDNPQFIINVINGSKRPIIIIDDFQYVMANEFMRRSTEKSFDKFTEIGRNAWDVFNAAINAHDHKRIYLLSHTEEDSQGKTKIKTIGKMLDEKITLEGMVTICLQTSVINDQYIFQTKNNGSSTVKAPMGLFEDDHLENDLNEVDTAICEYYNIPALSQQQNHQQQPA